MAMSGGKDDGSPMMEMNTTPLIDVMLCMLIIFILSIPVATHAVNIDLPAPSDVPSNAVINPIKNKVVITQNDVILWNGTPLNEGQFVATLQQAVAMQPEPELQFQPEEFASYETSANVLKIIKGSGATKFGFVGNEQYRDFASAPKDVNAATTVQ